MVIFVKKINVQDPRLDVLYCICVFLFIATFGILAVVMQIYDEQVPIGESIWTRVYVPQVEDQDYATLQKGFQRMVNEPVCTTPQNYDYWWSTTYKYENYSCISLCGLYEVGNHCFNRYELIQAKDDLALVIVTEIENDPLVNGGTRNHYFVPWDPETLTIRLYYGTITKDVSWIKSNHKGSDEHHSTTTDILTVVQSWDGADQLMLEPQPYLDFTLADILKWSGKGVGLDLPGPGANPNVKPGSTLPRVTPRISGMNIKANLECFTKPPRGKDWRNGPTCHIRFEHYQGPWVGEPYIRVVSSSGDIAGSYYHGTRISFVRNGYFSYPTLLLLYKGLVDLIVLSVWPKFFVLAVAIGCLGLKSKIYDQAIRQRFDIMDECKGTIARLLTYSLDFEVFKGASAKNNVSRLVVAERLAEAMKEHKGTIDKVELLALVYFCHHAMMRTNPVEPGICQRFVKDLCESCGRVPPSELNDYHDHHQRAEPAGVTSTQFSMCCCNDETIEFADLCSLFDVDRKKTWLETIFCQSDALVKAYADHADQNFEDEQDSVKRTLAGKVGTDESRRMNDRMISLEQFFRQKYDAKELDEFGVGSLGKDPVASKNILESRSSLGEFGMGRQDTFHDKFYAEHGSAEVATNNNKLLIDEDHDGIIDATELEHVDWELHEGAYIEKGSDIEKADMTLAEAKKRAKKIGAAGFCHVGPVTDEVTTMYFKRKVVLCPSPAPGSKIVWTSYVANKTRHRDELLGAFKMFDRDNNGQVSMAEMNNVMTAVPAACLHIVGKPDHNVEIDGKKANADKKNALVDKRTDHRAWEEVCEECIAIAVKNAVDPEKVDGKLTKKQEDAEARAEKWIMELAQHGLCPSEGRFKSGEQIRAAILEKYPLGKTFYASCKFFRTELEKVKASYTTHKVVEEIQVRQSEDARITQISFVYSFKDKREERKTWGATPGKFMSKFSLRSEEGEYITKISQRFRPGDNPNEQWLCMLKFTTNTGRESDIFGSANKGYPLPNIEVAPLRQIFGLEFFDESTGDYETGKLEGMIRSIETRLAPREITQVNFTVPIDDNSGGETLHFVIEGTKIALNIADARVEQHCEHVAQNLKSWGTVRLRCVVDQLHYKKGRPAMIEITFKIDKVRWKDETANAHKECVHELDAIREMRKITTLNVNVPWEVVGDLERMAEAIGMENTLPEVILDSRPLNETEVAELLKEIDDNGDGMVSYQEFIHILLNQGASDGLVNEKDQFVSGEMH